MRGRKEIENDRALFLPHFVSVLVIKSYSKKVYRYEHTYIRKYDVSLHMWRVIVEIVCWLSSPRSAAAFRRGRRGTGPSGQQKSTGKGDDDGGEEKQIESDASERSRCVSSESREQVGAAADDDELGRTYGRQSLNGWNERSERASERARKEEEEAEGRKEVSYNDNDDDEWRKCMSLAATLCLAEKTPIEKADDQGFIAAAHRKV